MAAVLAKGTTVIENAAREPEVARPGRLPQRDGRAASAGRDLAASRSRASTTLHPATHAVIPDRVVVATFLAAAGLAGGEVVVEDAPARPHGDADPQARRRWACEIDQEPDGLRAAHGPGRLRVGRRGHAALPGRRHRLQAAARRRCSRSPTAWASSPRTSSSGGSATSTSCAGWGPTSAPRATTPWSAASTALSGRAGAGLRRPGRRRAGAGRPGRRRRDRGRRDAHHVDRGYEDLAGQAALARRPTWRAT